MYPFRPWVNRGGSGRNGSLWQLACPDRNYVNYECGKNLYAWYLADRRELAEDSDGGYLSGAEAPVPVQ